MRFRTAAFLRTLLLCFGFFLLAFTGVANAQYTSPGAVSDDTVVAGETIQFSGSGFAPGSQVTIVLGAEVVGNVGADSQGNFVASVSVPQCFPAGPTTLRGTGTNAAGGTREVTAGITVSENCPDGAAGGGRAGVGDGAAVDGRRGLPRTGQASTAPLVAAGVGLVLIGTVAVATARRRRSEAAGL